MRLEILILAAGASSRMRGVDKLLQPVNGQPLIAHVARVALGTGLPVSITLDINRSARIAALTVLGLRQIAVPDPDTGMTGSLQAGLSALPPGTSAMVLLADMPDLTTEDLLCLCDMATAKPDLILRGASSSGEVGHPVLFPPWLHPEILSLPGAASPRDVMRRHRERIHLVPLPGTHATTDLDTPEDWALWAAARQI